MPMMIQPCLFHVLIRTSLPPFYSFMPEVAIVCMTLLWEMMNSVIGTIISSSATAAPTPALAIPP